MAMGWCSNGETAGFIAAVVGAIVLLVPYRLLVSVKNQARRERRGPLYQQGPRDWLCQTAGAAAPFGGK
jgi:hypothetical protein